MYLIDLHKKYFYRTDEGDVVNRDRAKYDRLTYIQIGLLILAIVIAIVGCYDYYTLKRIEYADSWEWSKFIWGVQKCKSL